MELDRRIKDGRRPLCCIDIREAIQFIEMKGYFANDLGAFKYLGFTDHTQRFTSLSYGTLNEVDNGSEKAFSDKIGHKFNYFLPEEWIEPEQKYRPYSLDEWKRTHELGTEVVFRKKRKDLESAESAKPVMHRVFLGYDEGECNFEKIHLGYSAFTLCTLFEKYEIYEDGTWKPFGVNCKSDNPVSNKTILEAINKVRCY
jgi:hypothetical protein